MSNGEATQHHHTTRDGGTPHAAGMALCHQLMTGNTLGEEMSSYDEMSRAALQRAEAGVQPGSSANISQNVAPQFNSSCADR